MNSFEEKRTRILIGRDKVSNVSSSDFPFNYHNQQELPFAFECRIYSLSKFELHFDMIGIDAAIANSIRRYIIAEVPTAAAEMVYFTNNTGIMQDEVLAHRIGLIPLHIDPREFEFKGKEDLSTDLNTVVFQLDVSCAAKVGAKKDAVDPKEKYVNSSVYSKELRWVPQGDQASKYRSLGPVHDDILLTKLRPGQQICAEIHVVKGIGQDHAKFSPVCMSQIFSYYLASLGYRLLPEINILKAIIGEDAYKFQKCFPAGVIDIEIIDDIPHAKVINARLDTVSRECLNHPEFEGKVQLTRVRDHFICK